MEGKEFTRRACVIGNWSRFVRPGFVRVEATPSQKINILLSAFWDPATNRLVIVLVNLRNTELEQEISIKNGTVPSAFNVWTTSDSLALKQSGIQKVYPEGVVRIMLPPRSVTTLVSEI